MVIFRRKVYERLLSWKNEEKGKCALLVEGARRVGKSTVVEEFGKNEYKSYVKIDFSIKNEDLIDVFENYSSDLEKFFTHLQLVTGSHLYTRDSLIIFDEIQNYPYARQMIKYLVADGRFDYIETGSLISIRKNVVNIQIPSEERHIEMFPLDFEEFLWAQGDTVSTSILRSVFSDKEPLGKGSHRKLIDAFRTYMVVGGMPQVVDKFLTTGNFMDAEKVKRDIIDLYRLDLEKLPGNLGFRALKIFDSIPALLSAHSKVFSPGKIESKSRNRQYEGSITWLREAKLINICECVDDPSVAYGLTLNHSRFKCYFLDTGLLLSLAFGKNRKELEDTYMAMVRGKLSVNEGMFFENVVAQELKAHGHDLVFTVFRHKDVTTQYEVDFLIPGSGKISPIEVKSSASSRHKSLDVFMEKFGTRTDTAYVIHSKDLRVDGKVVYLPIYMTMFL
ncbi:ATP-binding protein [Methanomethylophilus alvi]|uniref:ATP-binding protein n=1 Tax=Methanomethylophilus alvi TaxID=1291540 RepID=UPI0037DD27C3